MLRITRDGDESSRTRIKKSKKESLGGHHIEGMVRDEGNGSDRDERVGLFAFVGLVLTEMKRRE